MTQDESDAAYQQSVLHHNAPATAQKLRRLVERIEHLIETHQTTDGALRSALKDAKAP